MPRGFDSRERWELNLRIWLRRSEFNYVDVETSWGMPTQQRLIKLVPKASPLESVLVAMVAYALTHPEDFQEFIKWQVNTPENEREEGFA